MKAYVGHSNSEHRLESYRLIRADVVVEKQQVRPPPAPTVLLGLPDELLPHWAVHQSLHKADLQQYDERIRRYNSAEPSPQLLPEDLDRKVRILADVLEEVDGQQHARDRQERLHVVLELGDVDHGDRFVLDALHVVRVRGRCLAVGGRNVQKHHPAHLDHAERLEKLQILTNPPISRILQAIDVPRYRKRHQQLIAAGFRRLHEVIRWGVLSGSHPQVVHRRSYHRQHQQQRYHVEQYLQRVNRLHSVLLGVAVVDLNLRLNLQMVPSADLLVDAGLGKSGVRLLIVGQRVELRRITADRVEELFALLDAHATLQPGVIVVEGVLRKCLQGWERMDGNKKKRDDRYMFVWAVKCQAAM